MINILSNESWKVHDECVSLPQFPKMLPSMTQRIYGAQIFLAHILVVVVQVVNFQTLRRKSTKVATVFAFA
ncbi:hypothetical protein BKM26_22290 [Pseudomonas avellanae pv. morsprunorum]|uniref:Uncharacterized protein n=1 Tax=Pseudomonas avellanae pv. morsprunorum TaxID=3380385 RepID=A0ABX4YTA2_9PSED|nr:hypothetical protein BKM26_22290 [Pseudomonas avellanae]